MQTPVAVQACGHRRELALRLGLRLSTQVRIASPDDARVVEGLARVLGLNLDAPRGLNKVTQERRLSLEPGSAAIALSQ